MSMPEGGRGNNWGRPQRLDACSASPKVLEVSRRRPPDPFLGIFYFAQTGQHHFAPTLATLFLAKFSFEVN